MKKKIAAVLLCAGLCLAVLACFLWARRDVTRLGVDAEVLSISARDQTMEVRYLGETQEGELRFKIDCGQAVEQHQLLYCDYETGDVWEIGFDTLRVGDKVILAMDNQDYLALENGDHVQVQQVQLGTQRLSAAG